MLCRKWLVATALVLLVPLVLLAEDWPQWRGPERTGTSKETGLLQEWPEGGPKLLWKNEKVAGGYSTPAIAKGKIFLMGDRDGEEYCFALQENDGQQVWSVPVGKVGKNTGPQYPGTRSTPTVDGERLYALASDGELACLEVSTGKTIWKKHYRTDFAGKVGPWAYSESVLIDGDVLVGTPGGAKATLVALNKQTGDVIWQSAVPEGDEADYASIIIAQADGVKQYVQFLRKGVVGVDAKTGKFLWRYSRTIDPGANIATPLFHNNGVFSGGSRSGGALVRLKATGSNVAAEEVYFSKELTSAIGGFVRVGDHVYGTNNRALQCWEYETGKVAWSDQTTKRGSLCYADGHLYVRNEDNGQVLLVEATPAAFKLKGKLDQPDRSKIKAWPYPVVANGRLYLRDQNVLLCYQVRQ